MWFIKIKIISSAIVKGVFYGTIAASIVIFAQFLTINLANTAGLF